MRLLKRIKYQVGQRTEAQKHGEESAQYCK